MMFAAVYYFRANMEKKIRYNEHIPIDLLAAFLCSFPDASDGCQKVDMTGAALE